MKVLDNRGYASAVFIIITFLLLGIPLITRNAYRSMAGRTDHTGVVVGVGNRLKGSIGGNNSSNVTQKFNFILNENGQKNSYNCDDARCSSISKGDNITLNCYEEVHLFSPNEWECRFKSVN